MALDTQQPTIPAAPAVSTTEATNAKMLTQSVGKLVEALQGGNVDVVAAINAITSAITASIIGGTTGATANRVLVAKGTGGFALQASSASIDPTTGTLTILGVGDTGFEIGRVDGNASSPFIDFHSGATAVDYDVRLLATGGSGVAGGGTLAITAATFTYNANAVLHAAGGTNLTGGFSATSDNDGSKSSGTYTPVFTEGNLKRITNDGAFTLGVPSGEGTCVIQMTNGASAGTVTTSSYTKVTGSTLTTTNGDDFLLFIAVVNGFSHLNVVALQ